MPGVFPVVLGVRRNEALAPGLVASHLLQRRTFGRRLSLAGTAVGLGVTAGCGVVLAWLALTLAQERLVFSAVALIDLDPSAELKPLVADGVPGDLGEAAFWLLVLPPTAFLAHALGRLTFRSLRRLRWWARDRGRPLPPALGSLAGAGEGAEVRVRGRILPAPGFLSPAGRAQVVLASCFGSIGGMRGRGSAEAFRWELYGVDFTLALDGGEEVCVRIAGASLRAAPRRAPVHRSGTRPLAVALLSTRVAAIYREDALAAGDEVEVCGVLEWEIDPAADAGPRGTRLQAVLRSAPGAPVLVAPLAPLQ